MEKSSMVLPLKIVIVNIPIGSLLIVNREHPNGK
ncbi:hypothetical protein CJA_0539 [Cellvibrio japonicus Ueda107]|uniref:Uncharacterized protein n=1 Tax=Cellvibrio japonicus (strain Ueda107) TaxID=498211 RepID=B3PJ28_CELJU|nr:hypothetical protein CJA_0539 [Cellvibrio japonicus Ueda107]